MTSISSFALLSRKSFLNDDEYYSSSEDESGEENNITISAPISFKTGAAHVFNCSDSNAATENDINAKFQKILQSRGLELDVKQRLEEIPIDRKRAIVGMSLQGGLSEFDVNYYISFLQVATQCLEAFQEQQILEVMKSMCAFLRSREVKFVDEFIHKSGMQLLSSLLASYTRTHSWQHQSDMEILMQIIMCYEAIVDSDMGIQELINSPNVVNTLCLILDFDAMQKGNKRNRLSLMDIRKRAEFANIDVAPIMRKIASRAVRSKIEAYKEEQRSILFRFATIRIIFLLSVLCYASDKGFRVVLSALNQFKQFKW